MLDGLAAQWNLVGIFVEPLLDALQNVLVLPASDMALFASGASVLDHALHALVRPVVP